MRRTTATDVWGASQLVVMASVLGAAVGCVESGTIIKDVELRVVASEQRVFDGRDGWSVELSEARLAFGPIALCPGRNAGEFCETARGEWQDSIVVDGLDSGSRRAGYLTATSGPVLSWMYDYGLSSLLTQSEPYITAAAEELDGNSVVLRGCAEKNAERVCFDLRTPVAQTTQTEQGVAVVRVSGVRGVDDLARATRLTVGFDVGSWVSAIDFAVLAAERDCVECETVRPQPDSQAVRAVHTALTGASQPTLSWKW